MQYPEKPMATFASGILNYWHCFHSHSPCTVVWKIQFTMSVSKDPHRHVIGSNIFQHLVKITTALTVCTIVLCIIQHMMTFSALLTICAGYSPVSGEFPVQRPVTRALMFSLICARMNGWVNNGEAGDLRRHRGHYNVTVMHVSLASEAFATPGG